jgi:hypothetical protein
MMRPGIECIVKSANEPQLDRVLEAVSNQTLPFARVTHINGVSPEVEAHNKALAMLEYKWSLWVDGDVILNKNAHSVVAGLMGKAKKFTEYGFGLNDTFLQRVVCCCAVRKSRFHQRFPYKDILSNDTECARRMVKAGWLYKKYWRQGIVIGTHFDDPSEFQVFRRFYGRGHKAIKRPRAIKRYNRELKDLFMRTGDQRYKLALKAFNYAIESDNYPTSKDVLFERKVYEQWMN